MAKTKKPKPTKPTKPLSTDGTVPGGDPPPNPPGTK